MLTESDARKLRELMLDPELRIRRLTSIIDENNEWAKLDPLFEEQVPVETIIRHVREAQAKDALLRANWTAR